MARIFYIRLLPYISEIVLFENLQWMEGGVHIQTDTRVRCVYDCKY